MKHDDEAKRPTLLAAFRKQIDWCQALGSPFTAEVLDILADEIAAGGPAARLMSGWPGDPVADALPLRLAAALHALVLSGADAALGRHYPASRTFDGAADRAALRTAIMAAIVDAEPFIAEFVSSPPQTNEVGRSGVLLGGFLRVAALTGRPLRTLEMGASAGLNLIWDRYRYRYGPVAWGDPASRILLAPVSEGPPPAIDAPVRVEERRGCDVAPIDLGDPAQRLRLRAYVWADQTERLERLDAAIAMAREAAIAVERADAASWVEARLREPRPGCATVLYHSVMWQYMAAGHQAAIAAAVARAGAAASAGAPLAWLRFEPVGATGPFELRLTLWPGGCDRRIAEAQPHGAHVRWFDPDQAA